MGVKEVQGELFQVCRGRRWEQEGLGSVISLGGKGR